MTPSAEAARPLPAQRAFVVQFSAQTNVELGRFASRIEHVVSGHARRFQSLEELVASLVQMLTTLGATPAEAREGMHEGTNEPSG